MRTCFRFALLIILAAVLSTPTAPATAANAPGASAKTAPSAPVSPEATPGPCSAPSTLPSGALATYCVPSDGWNGDLVIWAHGYVPPGAPLGFPNIELAALAQSQGFAFATTSYRRNGLAILEGVQDIRELSDAFTSATGKSRPARVYLIGASEGGAVVTLLLERYPEEFAGGLATCGPIGDFRRQINYVADFRVLFDYFFPGVLPGSPVEIPAELIANWDSTYAPAVRAALAANPSAARQLISTAKAAIDPNDPASLEKTTLDVLWYNVFATNDVRAQLGGNPYDNRSRRYWGSASDAQLNANVQRFSADPAALTALQNYQSAGSTSKPLVTMHTTADAIVPFWHAVLYDWRYRATGQGSHTPILINRYGHCTFTNEETLAAFGVLVHKVLVVPPSPIDLNAARAAFNAARPSALAQLAPPNYLPALRR
ncbi:MAG TPA: alpha/beta hydrolase [Roseiflexaceae bacterium]|nr:alpha/beta hydrolase [Roseiflexaceae bacterium]